jgi:hypothetical protein
MFVWNIHMKENDNKIQDEKRQNKTQKQIYMWRDLQDSTSGLTQLPS